MATTLPASWYVDATRHDRERRAVFGRSWQFVAFRSRLRAPGDYVAVDVAGWPIVVVVDDDGVLRGHHNVCRHRAGPLVETGTGRLPSFVCRYHGWAYALDGTLRSARDFGEDVACSLLPLAVDEWRGLVFASVDPPSPLREWLGTFADATAAFAIESFVPVVEADHDLACNWKAYADNYLEGYHIPLVHPGLHKEIDAKRYEVLVDEGDRWVEHRAPARDGAVNLGRWLWKWPNLALNLYPGGMNVERYEPAGPRTTRVRYSFAFGTIGDAANDAANQEVVRVGTTILEEDRAICEAVQRNLDAGVYDTGWLSPRHEMGVAAFQRWVAEAVDGR